MRRLAAAFAAACALATLPALAAQAATVLPCGTTQVAGLTVAAGDVLEFPADCSATLETSGSVVVEGALRMRPADLSVVHTLRFVGVVESSYVGGGDGVTPSDVGLWVEGAGVLDAQGTPRAGWNRTGTDPSWLPGDELVQMPIAKGQTTYPAHTQGSAVPSVTAPDGVVHATEVANLTRNVQIEGTPTGRAHVRIHSTGPQTIRHAAIRWMGPRKDANGDGYTDPVAGRTGLHFHRMDNASRTSLVEGVVLRDIGGGMALDLHRSHGVTVRDTVIYGTNGSGVGWAMVEADATHDTLLDRVLVAKFDPIPAHRGYNVGSFELANGLGNTVQDSVAVGNRGNKTASGFNWPEGTDAETDTVWDFRRNVAHNNKADGAYIWQNTAAEHDLHDSTFFHNAVGLDVGAYRNAYAFFGNRTFGNSVGVQLHAVSVLGNVTGRPLAFVGGGFWDGVKLTKHYTSAMVRTEFRDARVSALVVAELVNGGAHSDLLDLVNTGLPKAAVTVTSIHPSTVVRVADGADCWQVTSAGVATIPCWG